MICIDTGRYGLLRSSMGLGMNNHQYSTAEAARQIGVSAITLKRWLLQKKVSEVARNRNGWRIFMQSDIDRIKEYAQRLTVPEMKK